MHPIFSCGLQPDQGCNQEQHSGKKGFGSVVDAPWTTFAAKLIYDAQGSVVPVYFPGRNRRAFHLASHIAEPLRMALLLSEARHRFRKPLDAVVGNTLGWETLSQ